MKLGDRLHLAGLSPSNTVSVLASLGVERCRTTAHNWIQKAGEQPADGRNPKHVAVDETVIQVNDQATGCTPRSISPPTARCTSGSSRPEPLR